MWSTVERPSEQMLISWYYIISWHSTKTTQNILETQALRFSGSNKTFTSFYFLHVIREPMGFPSSSPGEESACNAGEPGSIPGSGRSPGEGISYPLQYCPPLVAQTVKKPPVMQETQVQSLGGEDPLEKEMATHSSILTSKIPRTEEPGVLQSMGSQRVRHNLATKP